MTLDHCRTILPEWIQTGAHGARCHLLAPSHNSDDESLKSQAIKVSPIQEIAVTEQPVLTVEKLRVHFPVRKGLFQRVVGHVKAVDDVSLQLRQAETVALVGESGCGKTTVGKAILQLVPITDGRVTYQGVLLNTLSASELKPHRNALQIVFQDPYSSMNPRMTVTQVIEEAMISGTGRQDAATRAKRVDSLLERVGLDAQYKYRYPHEFSGGQRQRICIARALAADPNLIRCLSAGTNTEFVTRITTRV